MSKNLNKIFFDLDNTLIDTEKNKEFLYRTAIVHGFTREKAVEIYREARANGDQIKISFDYYVNLLNEKLKKRGDNLSLGEIQKIRNEMRTATSLLPGAKELLEFCRECGVDCYLLSLGVSEWLLEKIKAAHVDDYFAEDKMIFTEKIGEGKIEAIKRICGEHFAGEGAILFNDKPEESKRVLEAFPELIVFLRRVIIKDTQPGGVYDPQKYDEVTENFGNRVVYNEDLRELEKSLQGKYFVRI